MAQRASIFATAALAATTAFSSTADAVPKKTFPEVTTPGFADTIDQKLAQGCPGGVLPQNDPAAGKKCVDAVWSASYDIASHLSDYVTSNSGAFGTFLGMDAGDLAQGELLKCEFASRLMNEQTSKEANQDKDFTSDDLIAYAENGRRVAANCLDNVDTAENGIEIWLDTPAQNHLIDQMNCMVNPEGCARKESSAQSIPFENIPLEKEAETNWDLSIYNKDTLRPLIAEMRQECEQDLTLRAEAIQCFKAKQQAVVGLGQGIVQAFDIAKSKTNDSSLVRNLTQAGREVSQKCVDAFTSTTNPIKGKYEDILSPIESLTENCLSTIHQHGYEGSLGYQGISKVPLNNYPSDDSTIRAMKEISGYSLKLQNN